MGKQKYFWMVLLFWVLSGCFVPIVYADDVVKWKPVVEMEGQVFPSFLLATANIKSASENERTPSYYVGDAKGLIGITVVPVADDSKIKLELPETSLFEQTSIEATLKQKGITYTIFPVIRYKYDSMSKIRQSKPMIVTLRLTVNGNLEEKTETVRIRSINDCPLLVTVGCDSKPLVMPWMFAAYVNEDHPYVDGILKEALKRKLVSQFDGYQSKNPKQVYMQVYAIWNILQRRGFRYSSVTQVASESDRIFSQHVRFIDQSIKSNQANCVDGSVLFASVLRKIGIDVDLVLMPSHCLICFYASPERKDPVKLETTMLGSIDSDRYTDDPVKVLLGGKSKNDAAWTTFNQAVKVGYKKVYDNKQGFADGRVGYVVLPISVARKKGINPIPYEPALDEELR